MKHVKIILLLIAHCFPILVLADGMYAGFGIGTSLPKIDERDVAEFSDDELVWAGKLFTGYEFNHNWGLEIGYNFYEGINYDSQRDLVGTYDVDIGRQDIYIAPVYQLNLNDFYPLRLAAGLSYSKLELDVKEGFFGLAPPVSVSAQDNDVGLYFMASLTALDFKHMSALISVEYILRDEMFDDAINSINSNELMLSISMLFH